MRRKSTCWAGKLECRVERRHEPGDVTPSVIGSPYEARTGRRFRREADCVFSGARAVDFPVHGGRDRRVGRHEPEIPEQGATRQEFPT
jgi:hypothetical protein